MGLALVAGVLAVAAIVAMSGGGVAAVAADGSSPQATISALGPYPGPGKCEVFPDPPPASLPATAASQPNQSAWNQDVSQGHVC